MPHTTVLRELAKGALRTAGAEITDAASDYWTRIERDDRLPDKPFGQGFREEAFSVWGDVSSSVSETLTGGGPRRR